MLDVEIPSTASSDHKVAHSYWGCGAVWEPETVMGHSVAEEQYHWRVSPCEGREPASAGPCHQPDHVGRDGCAVKHVRAQGPHDDKGQRFHAGLHCQDRMRSEEILARRMSHRRILGWVEPSEEVRGVGLRIQREMGSRCENVNHE